jgi:thiol-disulfide isomerase/thioredoxin
MATRKSIIEIIKKNGLNAFLIIFTLVLLFSPQAKAWVLQQLLKTGFFNTEIRKNAATELDIYNQAFELTSLNGVKLTAEALKGNVVFINFWASWCPPCRAEMPSLQALYNKLNGNKNIVFLFITEDDDVTKAAAYLQAQQLNLPVYIPASALPKEVFSGTLPTTVVLDKQGRVVLKHEGLGNFNTEAFITQLQNLQ